MSKKASVTLVKRSSLKSSIKAASAAGPVLDFQLVDNEDSTCTVLGVDAAGNVVDIASVASLTPDPSSSDPSIVSVDTPSGMTFAMHAVGPLGAASITATATWGDGSLGPFTFTLPVTVVAGAASGIVIVPGTPTVR